MAESLRRKNIVAIIGSASANSANEKLVDNFIRLTGHDFDVRVYNNLKSLPHFDPELSGNNPPAQVIAFRDLIQHADGIVICTPEYVFSIPSGLKNAIEWCVATTVFNNKPIGIITASANGEKGHEELQLIMKTVMAKFNDQTTLLIQGIKGKIDREGRITNEEAMADLVRFTEAFRSLVK